MTWPWVIGPSQHPDAHSPPHHGRRSIHVGGIDLGTSPNQLPHNSIMPIPRRKLQGRRSIHVGGIDIGTSLNQLPINSHMPILRRKKQDRESIIVGGIDIGASLGQSLASSTALAPCVEWIPLRTSRRKV